MSNQMTELSKKLLIKRSRTQINNRNLAVPYGFTNRGLSITDRRRKPSMWVLHSNYHAKYSSRESWWIRASYLCGHSDGQDWAVRVPGTITTVKGALEWLTPAAVKQAIAKKKPVHRQGDMYFIPVRLAQNDFSALRGTNHTVVYRVLDNVHTGNVIITHTEHPPVALTLNGPTRWRAIQQKQLHIGNTRIGAD